MNRFRSTLAGIIQSPRRAMLVGAAGLGAVVVGVLLAIVVSGVRDGQQTANEQPSALGEVGSPSAALPSPSVSMPAAPVAAPSNVEPTQSRALTPSESATASPFPSTSEPMPSAADGYGGVDPGPTFDITGVWEALAPMPGGSDFLTADSLVLPDGRMVVFRWDWGFEDEAWPEVVIYDPQADLWQPASLPADRPFIGTDQSFALASDGRIYTHDYVIDQMGDDWRIVPFQLVRETETWAGMTLAAGPDGRVYHSADDTGGYRTQLIAYDPETDAFERSSVVDGKYDIVIAGGDSLVLLGVDDVGQSIIAYDPGTDAWSTARRIQTDHIATHHAAVGPDSLIYAPAFDPDAPALWALSTGDGQWRTVQPPDDLDDSVELLLGPDDRLYAFGAERAWAFTPGN